MSSALEPSTRAQEACASPAPVGLLASPAPADWRRGALGRCLTSGTSDPAAFGLERREMTARGAKAGNGGPASSPEKQGGAPTPAPCLSLGQDTPGMRWAWCTDGAETVTDEAPCGHSSRMSELPSTVLPAAADLSAL